MAYAAVVTSSEFRVSGRRHVTIKVAETDGAAASQWSTTGIAIPRDGTITLRQQTLESGTGTTIAPRIGKASGWSDDSTDAVLQDVTANDHHRDQTPIRYSFPVGTAAILWGKSVPNAGSDNVITTLIEISEGHHP